MPLFATLAWAVVFAPMSSASAGDGHCQHCGRAVCCQRVCRLVEEEKKVEITCWGSKCEDFCLPCPSKPGCKHCKAVCNECDANCDCRAPHATPKKFTWRDWIPCGAKMYTKKKLMKKVETEKVPSYKWTVEELCCECARTCRQENAALVRSASTHTPIALPPIEK